jgi:hypothetical protein
MVEQADWSADKVVNGEGVSRTLAQSVAAGTGKDVQDVHFRAGGQNDEVFFDNYKTGEVDVADFKNADANVQATMLSHIVKERYATKNHEANKDAYGSEYLKATGNADAAMKTPAGLAHAAGLANETKTVEDVTGRDLGSDATRTELPGTNTWTYGSSGSVDISFQRSESGAVKSATMTVK